MSELSMVKKHLQVLRCLVNLQLTVVDLADEINHKDYTRGIMTLSVLTEQCKRLRDACVSSQRGGD